MACRRERTLVPWYPSVAASLGSIPLWNALATCDLAGSEPFGNDLESVPSPGMSIHS